MKKNLLLFLFIFSFINCFTQELKKIKNINNTGVSEIYHVLKSDKNVRHGSYELTLYGEPSKKGQYTNGKKSGIWHYYNSNLCLNFSYNYDSLKLISDSSCKERPALYSEGYLYFNHLVVSSVIYPIEAVEAKMSGNVWISFSVDSNGIPGNFSVSSGFIGKPLEEEALRVVKKAAMEHPWYPAVDSKGENAKFTTKWPVAFRIQL